MGTLKFLLGKKIKERRNHLGMTQAQLAEIVNVDTKHISCIENGKNFPSADLIERLASALQIEIKDLFEYGYLDEPKNLKKEIINIVDELSHSELSLVYKYVKTFLLK